MSSATLESRVAALETDLAASKADLDTFYLIWASGLVFLMQAGFAMLSAGSIRAKNVKNILLKSVLDACLGGLIWYFIGYGFAYGGTSGFIGTGNFVLKDIDDISATDHGYDWVSFFFQYCFCAACATIVSGAVAERTQLGAYLIYCVVLIGFIYPVVVHWVWDSAGFLSAFNSESMMGGMIDFAGSGVVHMTGGLAAMVGAKVVGPRLGRFEPGVSDAQFSGHSAALQVLGTFLLWFGWYGFNPGSTLVIHTYARDAARSAVTTTLAACSGAVVGLYIKRMLPPSMGGSGVWDLGHTCNSLLGGLVGITAGTATISPAGSIIVGGIAAFVYHGASCLMRKLKIDDPLDAFAVHGACGMWGLIAVGLFTVSDYAYSGDPAMVDAGLFYGGNGTLFGIMIIGMFIEMAWVIGTASILFISLKMANILRTSQDVERAGMDISKHGGHAYPTENPSTSSA